jgi:MFS family permease
MCMVATGRREGIFYGWWIVVVVGIGLYLGYVPIIGFTFSVFFDPIRKAFNWSRADISLAFSVSLLSLSVMLPLVGRLVDRIGARRVILPSIVLFGLSLMSFYFLTAHLAHYYAIYFIAGIVGAGVGPVAYLEVLSHWFDKRRGLAIGLAMIGTGLSQFLLPTLGSWLIRSQGWRLAYVIIGLFVIVVAFPVIALFLKEKPQEIGLLPDGAEEVSVPGDRSAFVKAGLSHREAFRTTEFWVLSIGMFLVSVSLTGCLVHLVPMFIDRGLEPRAAAFAASVMGGANLLGRVVCGYLLDRMLVGRVATILFGASTIGILLLWVGGAGANVYLSALLIGLGMGAEGQVMAFAVSRYFGLKAFGEIYGYVLGIFTVGAMIGPVLMGLEYDHRGSYNLALAAFVAVTAAGTLLMTRLGRYPRWES